MRQGTYEPRTKYKYIVPGGGAEITEYKTAEFVLRIPQTIKGYPVTAGTKEEREKIAAVKTIAILNFAGLTMLPNRTR